MELFRNLTRRTKEFQKLMVQISVQSHIQTLLSGPRFQEPKRLLRYGFKAFSQNDEDGILNEIFRRIGTTNRYFVEFGVEGGQENNTLFLLLQGWQGLWLEGNPQQVTKIQARLQPQINSKNLKIAHAFVQPNNFSSLLKSNQVPAEIDLLSIDIDGNDYHVFAALEGVAPRVVVIEYNAKMHAPLEWVMPFQADHQWDGSDYFGASLNSLTALFQKKGYALVGCNLTGINAFFVRQDLVSEHFCAPFSAENHFEPARYFLTPGYVSGHPSR